MFFTVNNYDIEMLWYVSFFSENYTEEARQVLSHANHPKLG